MPINSDIISFFHNLGKKGGANKADLSIDNQAIPQWRQKEINQEAVAVDYSKLRFLVVDDFTTQGEMIKNMLTYAGALKVDISVGGLEAAEMFKMSAIRYYDVILTDIMMPELNGYNMSRKIRQSDRADGESVIIIAMTAHITPTAKRMLCDNGIDTYINKPMKINELTGILGKYLKAPDENETNNVKGL